MRVTYFPGRFIDREAELEALRAAWEGRPGLVIIYGRRRVGKTRLTLEWLRRHSEVRRYAYYHAVPARHEVNLAGLAASLEEHLGIRGLSRVSFRGIDSLLELASQYVSDAAIVIDEFTYWVRAEPRVVGELQRFVDHVLPSTKLMLVLTGSLVGVMFRDVLGGGAPLYGRASSRIKLGELRLRDLRMMHPSLSLEDLFLTYVAFGGVPFYHVLIRGYGDVAEAIWDLFLSPTARLRDEVSFMLRDEFRDPSTYYSVLKAIASGADTPSRIADVTGLHRQHVSKYLAVLEGLGLIDREVPLFGRKGRYVIRDKLIMTWFNIVEPITMRDPSPPKEATLAEVREKLRSQASAVFEEVGKRFATAWGYLHGVRFDAVGRFLHKGVEVDVVGVSKSRGEVHLFEVKWSDLSVEDAYRVAAGLKRKATHLPTSLLRYSIVPHLVVKACTDCDDLKSENILIHDLREVVELT